MKEPGSRRHAVFSFAVTVAATGLFARWLTRQDYYSNEAARIFLPLHPVFEGVALAPALLVILDGLGALRRAPDRRFRRTWRFLLRLAIGISIVVAHAVVLLAGGYLA